MSSANTDRRLVDALEILQRHIKSCGRCIYALKSDLPHEMCSNGMRFTLKAARHYDNVIKLRIQAHRDRAGYVFACPDITVHGEGYARTAEPLQVTGIQEGLI